MMKNQMPAVWSHWSKPFISSHPGAIWLSIKHYLMSFVLSLENAKQHFKETRLITDSIGAAMLVDEIGLEFDQVSVELDFLNNQYGFDWWNLGKLHAYRIQDKPFIHLDNDVFLWKPLPTTLLEAPVFAQNPEFFTENSDYYLPSEFEMAINQIEKGWLPEEWKWSRNLFGHFQKSMNTGIFGGQRPDLIHYAANLAFQILDHPINQISLESIEKKAQIAGMLEMYLPAACIDCYFGADVFAKYLFTSAEEAFEKGDSIGYTHLLGSSKRNLSIISRLEKRVEKEYPIYYERCVAFAEKPQLFL